MMLDSVDVSDIPLPNEFDELDVVVVGGFVRDQFLGRETNDIDLMVTGVSPTELDNREGFRHIDATSFPVFHDSMGREVAIARTEESTGAGHTDFEMATVPPNVPHEDAVRRDLERRDLTINAIAVDARSGEVHDPFGGRDDLAAGVLRHVSDAFREDPLRVVRAARYAARFGFDIAPETQALMEEVAPQMASLPNDRFGSELIKALRQASEPRRFFDVLSDVGGLEQAFPELAELREVPAGPEEYHGEGDAFEHAMRVLTAMFDRRGNDVNALLAAVAHDVGKAATPDDVLPNHYGHEQRGREITEEMRLRLEFVRERRGVMSAAARTHGILPQLREVGATSLLDIAHIVRDSPLSPAQVAALGGADQEGRVPQGSIDEAFVEERLQTAISVIDEVGGSAALTNRGYSPEDVGENIPGERVQELIRQDRAEELRARF